MNRRYSSFVAACVLHGFGIGAWAQSQPQPQQPETVVDGATNPELIPDSTAYRLWLVTVSATANATEQEKLRQDAHLGMLHLANDKDYAALVSLVVDFKAQYLALVANFNQLATEAIGRGEQVDQTFFLQQRDDLVQSTRASMKRLLTQEGMASIDAHVQSEKKRMKLHITKGAQ